MMLKKKSYSYFIICLILLGGITGLLLGLLKTSGWSVVTTTFFQYALVINFMLTAFAIPCRPLKFIITALPIIVIYSLIVAYSQYLQTQSPILYNTITYILLVVSFYIAYCYQQAMLLTTNKGEWQTNLINISWNTLFTLFLSGVFTLICWLVLLVSATLFEHFGIKFIGKIINSSMFIYVCFGILIGIGIASCRKYQQLILSLRQLFFTLCYFLLPIIGVITLLLFIAYLMSTNRQQVDNLSFLNLCLLIILLINAVHQYKPLPYNRYIRYLINLLIYLLPLLPLLILYKQSSLLLAYGIKPAVWQTMIIALLLLLYTITYFFCLLLSGRNVWLKQLPTSNCILAIVVLLVGIITNLPGLTPTQLSITNQTSRLLNNKPLINKDLQQGAYLKAANLSNKDLSGVNLAYAELSYANLAGANLTQANLEGAHLTHANLSNANLDKANLRNTWLFSANLSGASLNGTLLPQYNAFYNATGLTQQQLNQACSLNTYKLSNGLIVKPCKKESP